MSTQITFGGATIKTGNVFPQGQRITYKSDPSRGFSTIADFKGFSQTQLLAQYNQYVANGIACELTLYEDIGTLHVDDSTQEYTIDSWQILGNEESKDGFSHPSFLAALEGSTGDKFVTSGVALAQMQTFLSNDASTDDVDDYLFVHGYSGANSDIIGQFYTLKLQGATDYRQGNYVLRHTTNVSNRWQANISDFGIDEIYTPAQLLSEVSDSGLWIFPLPGRLQYKLAAIPPLGPQDAYLWGWLKSASTETNAANNRIDITTEYTSELWSLAPDGYYSAYSGTP